jgi:hypothetical protein
MAGENREEKFKPSVLVLNSAALADGFRLEGMS